MPTLAQLLATRMQEQSHTATDVATQCPGLDARQVERFLKGAFPTSRKNALSLVAAYLGMPEPDLVALRSPRERRTGLPPTPNLFSQTTDQAQVLLSILGVDKPFPSLDALRQHLEANQQTIRVSLLGKTRGFSSTEEALRWLKQVADAVGD